MDVPRFIMSTGFGFVVTTALGLMFLCAPATTIIPQSCTQLTPALLDAFVKAGFGVSGFAGVTSGAFVYFITGRWKHN